MSDDNVRHLPTSRASKGLAPTGIAPRRPLPPGKLWGHVCARCGTAFAYGPAWCPSCGAQDAMVALFFRPEDWPEEP